MTIKARRSLTLVVASLVALSLAGVTARMALAGASGPRYLTPARSVAVLNAAFGAVAERPIREPRVVVAPTSAATWALSDDVNMANQAWNPRTGRVWSRGDARAMWPGTMGGFTDPITGAVYINAETALESHVPHEILHANASPDFLLAVGVAVNEGVTQLLALEALASSGVEAEKAPAYAGERELAAAIAQLAGRDRLLRAYFNGGPHLDELVAAVGAGTLARMKHAAGGHRGP